MTFFRGDYGYIKKKWISKQDFVALKTAALLLPPALNLMNWALKEQSKNETQSLSAAFKTAIELEDAVEAYRAGNPDERIQAAHAQADLCAFLSPFVEPGPPEVAFNSDYIEYFVENYETILDQMSEAIIEASPGEVGLAFLQDLANDPDASQAKDAQELCQLFGLDPNAPSVEFKANGQVAFGLAPQNA
jgi:hypothetical protein